MFNDTLKVVLDLSIDNKRFRIPGANVKEFAVEITPYGFEARAGFWISGEKQKDKLFDKFIGKDLLEARLSVIGVYNQPPISPDPLLVQGPVVERSFRIHPSN